MDNLAIGRVDIGVLMRFVPPPCWVGTMFAKQDAYKLSKFGREFAEAFPDLGEAALIRAGNEIPYALEPTGTRLCMAADKLARMLSQSATAGLKKQPRSLEPSQFHPHSAGS